MSYVDNFNTLDKYGRRSFYEIESLDPSNNNDWEIIKKEYRAVDIDKVVIDANTFTNYGQYQFLWEKSYVKEPTRSSNGSIGNLNSYATFLTPHLIMNFDVMSIDDYRAIMRLHLEANEFVVECYDPIYNQKIKVKMYFTTEQIAKLHTLYRKRQNGNEWEDFVMLAGVREYSVEMVGTNNAIDTISVIYHLNPPSDTGYADQTVGENDIYRGEEIIIGSNTDFPSETFGGLYQFTHWSNTSDGNDTKKYIDGNAYTINGNLHLYARWESMTEHTLTFVYGNATPVKDNNGNDIINRKVTEGKSIGALPIPTLPTVTENNMNFSPYESGNWYKTQTVTSTSQPVSSSTPYWIDRDSVIYYILKPKQYTVTYNIKNVDSDSFYTYSTLTGDYNSFLATVTPYKEGYTFDGWYKDGTFTEKSSLSKIPPHNIHIYGRWVKN